jgi:hypothetical protein
MADFYNDSNYLSIFLNGNDQRHTPVSVSLIHCHEWPDLRSFFVQNSNRLHAIVWKKMFMFGLQTHRSLPNSANCH